MPQFVRRPWQPPSVRFAAGNDLGTIVQRTRQAALAAAEEQLRSSGATPECINLDSGNSFLRVAVFRWGRLGVGWGVGGWPAAPATLLAAQLAPAVERCLDWQVSPRRRGGPPCSPAAPRAWRCPRCKASSSTRRWSRWQRRSSRRWASPSTACTCGWRTTPPGGTSGLGEQQAWCRRTYGPCRLSASQTRPPSMPPRACCSTEHPLVRPRSARGGGVCRDGRRQACSPAHQPPACPLVRKSAQPIPARPDSLFLPLHAYQPPPACMPVCLPAGCSVSAPACQHPLGCTPLLRACRV